MRAPLVVAVLWLAAGILAGVVRPVPSWGGPPLLVLALIGVAVASIRIRRPGAGGPRRILGLFLLAGALLGAAERLAADRSCRGRVPADVALVVRGVVVDRSGDRRELRVERVELGGVRVDCGGRLPARLDGPAGRPGEAVVVWGRWWSPPGGRSVPVRAGVLLADSVRVAGRARRPGAIPTVQAAARVRVDSVFGRGAPLAAALLLAQRDGLDRDVRDRYARAGLSHLLAISGLHVGIVAGIFLLLAGLAPIRRGTAALAASLGTLAYVGLLGAPHSAARAGLQVVLALSARVLQRPARPEALMAAAALVLLVADPGALLGPGFQLSFAGVAGLLALRPTLANGLRPLARLRIGSVPAGRWLADGLAASAAATLATAPVAAWHFGRVAPIGIAANVLAVPLLAATVPALALALVAGWAWLPAGRFLAGAGLLCLDALDRIAGAAASAPGGTVAVPASTAVLVTAAAFAGYALTRRLGRVRRGVRAGAGAAVALAVLVAAPARPVADRVELHVIDVGQGDAVAVRSPAGRWLLVDAGVGTASYDAGARRVVPYLARRGVRRLEGLVITHPDADHMGGAGAVIAALRPRWIGDPGAVAGKPAYLALLRTGAASRGGWVALQGGVTLELDGMTVEFLHPERTGEPVSDANEASVVMRLEYGDFAALLTGDAPAEVEHRLVARYGRRLDADVLKVGHHGSATSTTAGLLAATGATHALISVGRGNRYGHPDPAVLSRLRTAGIAIARTDRHGTVVVRGTRNGGVTVSTERGGS